MLLFLLSLIGIPPLAGFVGKFTVFEAAIDAGFARLAGIAPATTVVTIYPYVRLIAPIYPAPQPDAALVATTGRTTALAIAVCAATVVLGPVAELITAFEGASFIP